MKHIYEIHSAVWLQQLRTQYGRDVTLATIPDEVIDTIASYHMDTVWLMGVWQRSPIAAEISRHDEELLAEVRALMPDATNDDIVGSAYAVRGYCVDERFGGEPGLQTFRAQLAARGMKLVLDFVPNHTAFDHSWLSEHPDYYITADATLATQQPDRYYPTRDRAVAKGADPNLSPWPDVAQLNAFSPGYRQASIATLQYIADLCDGVRCDMAMLLLNDVFARTWGDKAGERPEHEYWRQVIEAVRQTKPECMFIAECYWDTERVLVELGFDYCYDKRVYDAMVANDTSAIDRQISQLADIDTHVLHFLENHDEQRAASVFSPEQQREFARKIISLPGPCLWYDGQFLGYTKKLPTHLGSGPQETTNETIHAIYRELLS